MAVVDSMLTSLAFFSDTAGITPGFVIIMGFSLSETRVHLQRHAIKMHPKRIARMMQITMGTPSTSGAIDEAVVVESEAI